LLNSRLHSRQTEFNVELVSPVLLVRETFFLLRLLLFAEAAAIEVTLKFFRWLSTERNKAKRQPRAIGLPLCNLTNGENLKSLLQPNVPEPAFDGRKGLIVTVLEAACYKRRIFICHVLHAQRDGRVIKPPLPVAAAILGC
jgi:hypothetical protein